LTVVIVEHFDNISLSMMRIIAADYVYLVTKFYRHESPAADLPKAKKTNASPRSRSFGHFRCSAFGIEAGFRDS